MGRNPPSWDLSTLTNPVQHHQSQTTTQTTQPDPPSHHSLTAAIYAPSSPKQTTLVPAPPRAKQIAGPDACPEGLSYLKPGEGHECQEEHPSCSPPLLCTSSRRGRKDGLRGSFANCYLFPGFAVCWDNKNEVSSYPGTKDLGKIMHQALGFCRLGEEVTRWGLKTAVLHPATLSPEGSHGGWICRADNRGSYPPALPIEPTHEVLTKLKGSVKSAETPDWVLHLLFSASDAHCTYFRFSSSLSWRVE